MPKKHSLQGLEPDNLLAFLALLGFHRCLDHAEPAWHARVHWEGIPLRPSVVLSKDVERGDLAAAAARGAASLAGSYTFGRLNMDYSSEEAAGLLREASYRSNRS